MNIKMRLLVLGAILTIGPLMIVLVSNLTLNRKIVATAMEHNHDLGLENLDSIIDGVYKMIALQHEQGNDQTAVLQTIGKIKVGESGYVFIIKGTGSGQGEYVLSKNHTRDGENIWNAKDSNGVYFIQEMCQKALRLGPGEIAEQRYPWKNKGESKARMKVSRVAYFQPWDWVIGVGAYEDEFQKSAAMISHIGNQSAVILLITVLLSGSVSLLIWWTTSNGIALKIKKAVNFAEVVRQGDISQRLNSKDKDEMGELSRILDTMANALQNKAEMAERIAEGDLTQRIVLSSNRDSFGNALQKMTNNLHELINQVKATSDQVVSGTAEMSGASQSLSQGATEQASSLEEISSSVTQLSSQTKTNAENASQANQLTKTSQQAASQGSSQVNEMMGAMNAIHTSAKDIVKIIKVIDDIAFQTNLLALNAAVEAARAGKHGKGFAVVAEEVRSLAARSAKAAKETSELISESMKKVENGIQVANGTVAALDQIETGITKVSDLVGEIAASSNEQAQGISQINQGLNQIDTVTQRNTANAEETASAAQELNSQANKLKNLMARFKIKRSMQSLAQGQPYAEKTPGQMQPANQYQAANRQTQQTVSQPAEKKGNNGGWGRPNHTKVKHKHELPPDAIIALDDTEFGKY